MSCNCDVGESAAFCATTMRRARKDHRCYECGDTIEPGETYEVIEGMWDGSFETYKTCSGCVAAWSILEAAGWCRVFGDLRETWREHWTKDLPRSRLR